MKNKFKSFLFSSFIIFSASCSSQNIISFPQDSQIVSSQSVTGIKNQLVKISKLAMEILDKNKDNVIDSKDKINDLTSYSLISNLLKNKQVDLDHNNMVTFEELSNALKSSDVISKIMSDSEKIFVKTDKNGDNNLSFEDFLNLKQQTGLIDYINIKEFNSSDTNKNNVLDSSEFEDFYAKLYFIALKTTSNK